MAVTKVSHSCLYIELGPICNSISASMCLKSCEDQTSLKSYNGGSWENSYRSRPNALDHFFQTRNTDLSFVIHAKSRENTFDRIWLATQHRKWERRGSVIECLTRDRRTAGSSLTGVTALWSLSKTHLS